MALSKTHLRGFQLGIFSLYGHAGRDPSAGRVLDGVVAGGAAAYRRDRMLPRLLPLAVGRLPLREPARTGAILIRLARGLRAERRLGRAGHWTYDVNRHIALAQAFRAERLALERMVRGASQAAGGAQAAETPSRKRSTVA